MYKTPHIPILLSLASFSVSYLSGAESQTCAKFNLSDTANFVDERLVVQTINSREYDPFGLPQNPDKNVPDVPDVSDVPEVSEDDGEKVKKLQLNKLQGRVSIRGNGFFLGSNYYKVADQLSLEDGEVIFSLEVISVRKNVIQFRDLKSNELINLQQGPRQLPEATPLPEIPLSTGEKTPIKL